MKVQGEHALVTGATRGIGRAVAGELARRGARVTVVSRTPDAVAAVAGELDGHGISIDLADPDQVDRLTERALDGHGPVGILVNNAGLNAPTTLAATSAASLRAQLMTNLMAPLQLTRSVLPRMLDRNAGCVVNVGSIAGDVAIAHQVPYCASKSGLAAATRALQRELRGKNVQAMLVVLGLVATDMIADLSADPTSAATAKRFKALRALETEEVARAVVDAIEAGRTSLIMPKLLVPMHQLRLLPTYLTDGLLAGVHT